MQKRVWYTVICIMMFLTIVLTGCGQTNHPEAQTGTLLFTANGEEFIRDGFVSKDGWNLLFSHVYITLSEITAYHTNPAYYVNDGWDIIAVETVSLPGTFTVDLASPDADPAVLGHQENVPAGHYNAISWTMIKAQDGPAAGYMLVLEGTATRDGEVIEFILRFEEELVCQGGEYIGDERKGIIAAGVSADVEMTFHFDHLFGDGEEDPDDEINQEALGFDIFANLAENGRLEISSTELNPVDYNKLQTILLHLAHVGEGHCLIRFK